MQNIRRSVFETNSSSSHSITIADVDGLMDTSLIPDEDGNIVLNGGGFGWEWEKFNDAKTKANYLAIYVDLYRKENPEMKSVLCNVIKTQTGCKDVIFNFGQEKHFLSTQKEEDWDDEAYINHQSVDSKQYHYLWSNPEQIRQFIFNKGSYLFLGNDNSPCPPNFYDSEGTVYKYKLTIDSVLQEEKFVENPNFIEKNSYEIFDRLLDGEPWYDYDKFRLTDINGPEKVIDGKVLNSFSEIDKKKITLFKLKSVYDKKGNYQGKELVSEKILSFKIERI